MSKFQNVISADSHVNEPIHIFADALGDRFGEETPRVITEYQGQKGRFWFGGRQVVKLADAEADAEARYRYDAGYDPEVRVKFQEEAKIKGELLNPGRMSGIMANPNKEMVKACAQVYHDWLAEFISYDPVRLLGVSTIPVEDVDWAVNEIKRTGKQGCRSVLINFYPNDAPPLRHPVYEPIWATLQDLDMTLVLHILRGRLPDPLHFHKPEEQEEAPGRMIAVDYEIMDVLANDFIFGTILDRFPKLKVMCSEFEVSWIPSFMYRVDQIQNDYSHRMTLPKLEMKASEYMQSRIWHGFIDDPFAMDVLPRVGADQVVWGSDFPHIRSVGVDAQDRLSGLLEGIPRGDQEKIAGKNMARMLGL